MSQRKRSDAPHSDITKTTLYDLLQPLVLSSSDFLQKRPWCVYVATTCIFRDCPTDHLSVWRIPSSPSLTPFIFLPPSTTRFHPLISFLCRLLLLFTSSIFANICFYWKHVLLAMAHCSQNLSLEWGVSYIAQVLKAQRTSGLQSEVRPSLPVNGTVQCVNNETIGLWCVIFGLGICGLHQ